MAYTDLTATVAANLMGVTVDPGLPGITGKQSTEALPAVNLKFGTGAGQSNLFCLAKDTLVATTATIDLTAFVDPYGVSKDYVKAVGLMVLNDTTTDGHDLLVDLTVTNAWTAPLDGSPGKLKVFSGYTDPVTGGDRPGILFLFGGSAAAMGVSGTSKILTLDSGANTIPYRLFLIGRDA